MGGEFFTNFKSLNGIEISWLVQVLLNFNWFRMSSPGGVAEGWIGVGVGMNVWKDVPYMHACTCMHTYAHTHTHAFKHAKHVKHGCLHAGGHLQFLYMCVCVCACVHVCVCVCGDTPHAPRCPRHPHPPAPLPRATGSPKHQISISLELIKIIRFCLKILYLWTFLNSYRL